MKYFNFGAGPSMLPKEVLEKIKEDLPYWKKNMSVMEVGHRTPDFLEIIEKSEYNIRKLLNIPKHYKVLFLTGGARSQFSMIPINFLGNKTTADYIITGLWSKIAHEDGKLFCNANVVVNSEKEDFKFIPKQETWNLSENAAYVHYTDNESIHGVEFDYIPDVKNDIPLVCDMTSSILTKPIDINKYSLIYASAQKNMGIAGLTMVIVDDDKIKNIPMNTPPLYNYKKMIEYKSILNTPPTFSWYVMNLVLEWLINKGGISYCYEKSIEKSKKLYEFIDNSDLFYNEIINAYRSRINVPFHLKKKSLVDKFIFFAETNGMLQIKGHKVMGGIRASLYNAMPVEGVDALIDVMKDFENNY